MVVFRPEKSLTVQINPLTPMSDQTEFLLPISIQYQPDKR